MSFAVDSPPPYPIDLNIAKRLCVVIGGGRVALRKVSGLIVAGARVRVVAPLILPEIAALPGIELLHRPFQPDDLDGAFLVFAATDEPAVNAAVAAASLQRGLLIDRCDRPDEGSFTLPAVLRRGTLTLTCSSAGTSPALSAVVRDHLTDSFGPEWATVCAIAAALRRKQLTEAKRSAYNQAVLRHLLDADLPGLIAAGDVVAVDRLLAQVAGDGISLASLDVQLEKGTT